MPSIGRLFTAAIALAIAVPAGWSSSAAAQETSGEYREALNGLHAEMNALTLEIENFRVSARYCKPPGIPSKAEAQAELDALASRAEALNRRYNALKQSLKDFARNPRVAAELMLRDIDPTQDRWFSSYEAARRRMLDALARKRAALAAAPEVDCRPKPKPEPAVTTGGFQPPALPVRPSVTPTGWPALPSHFCSWDERIKFFEQFDPIYLKASDDAVAAAKFRTEVEQAVNSYVQNDKPVPADLIARRRQAIADVEAAARRVKEAEDMRRRALAIPVIDCRQPVQQEPPRQDMRTGQAPTAKPPLETGVSPADELGVASQQRTIENFEEALTELRSLVDHRKCEAVWDLVDELDEWLDDLEGGKVAPMIVSGLRNQAPPPRIPARLIMEWDRRIDDILENCPPPGVNRRLDVSTLLDLHNTERARFGYDPLRWSFRLAGNAQTYANHLASTGQRIHASREGRGIERENLSQGMIGWDTGQLVGSWLKERQYFKAGTFPDVSTTGDWYNVGHYSQMVWPTTMSIGCGLAYGKGFSWMVCRYSPGGNKDGKSVGLPQAPSPRHEVAGTPSSPQRGGGNVIANQDGIATPNSSTRVDPMAIHKLPIGGGMTQLDPPPPPRPTARDDAPEGKEENHPLVRFAQAADAQHAKEIECGNAAMARLELEKMRYAVDELKTRLKAARQAGPFSSIKPDDVQRQIDDLERRIREAEQRKPRGACPAPQQRGMVSQPAR